MENSPDTSDWQKRYAVIEKAYCQGRWATVVEAGTLFLRDLTEAGGEPEAMALHHRMQLLMAHTLLHGYGDRDAAEDLYEIVRRSEAEPALRQIAEDGLDQCHQPLVSTLVTEEEDEDEPVHSRPMLFLPETERTDLEEQSSPSRPPKAPSPAALQPLLSLPSMAPEPRPEPEAAANTTSPAPPTAGPTERSIAADPFTLPGEKATPAAAPSGAPVMPWLTQPRSVAPAEPVAGDLPWLQQRAASPSSVTPALIPDVVDEPELIEVHQSSPLLAEEVEVNVKSTSPAPEITPAFTTAASGEEEEDGELRTGLLLVIAG
jgi:hypothetical protein